jgi:hypothetical protein
MSGQSVSWAVSNSQRPGGHGVVAGDTAACLAMACIYGLIYFTCGSGYRLEACLYVGSFRVTDRFGIITGMVGTLSWQVTRRSVALGLQVVSTMEPDTCPEGPFVRRVGGCRRTVTDGCNNIPP